MNIGKILDRRHYRATQNRWIRYFAVFNRIALAAGFLPAGMVKIMGERFASGLSENHPMGQYLTALHHTGFYYTFIGIAQVTAAILLLIPRTVLLGALIYFPVILNICILSYAVRFDGSLVTSPLMLLANIYLLCWNYHKLKFIFPFHHDSDTSNLLRKQEISNRFPIGFFAGVAAVVVLVIVFAAAGFDVKPHNNMHDCVAQFQHSPDEHAGYVFCDCIHHKGLHLDSSLHIYYLTKEIDKLK